MKSCPTYVFAEKLRAAGRRLCQTVLMELLLRADKMVTESFRGRQT